jgi:hypothetical protein
MDIVIKSQIFVAPESNHSRPVTTDLALTQMSTMHLLGREGRPARNADNLTAICEPIA